MLSHISTVSAIEPVLHSRIETLNHFVFTFLLLLGIFFFSTCVTRGSQAVRDCRYHLYCRSFGFLAELGSACIFLISFHCFTVQSYLCWGTNKTSLNYKLQIGLLRLGLASNDQLSHQLWGSFPHTQLLCAHFPQHWGTFTTEVSTVNSLFHMGYCSSIEESILWMSHSITTWIGLTLEF